MKTSNKILTGTFALGLIGIVVFLIGLRTNIIEPTMLEGNGSITTIEREIQTFQNLRISNLIEVKLVPSATPSMRIITDENLQNILLFKEDDGHLSLQLADTIKAKPSNKIRVELGVQDLQNISLSGSSSVVSDSVLHIDFLNIRCTGASNVRLAIAADQLNLELLGASTADLSGKADFVDIRGSGASQIKAKDLESDKVHINLNGASTANIHAVKYLKVKASGASTVRYKDNPAQIEKNLNGASSLSKM